MSDINKLIDKLQNEKLCSFLTLRHWIELPSLFDGQVRQFATPNENDAIMIPIHNNFSDFYRVMSESLNTIALSENTTLKGLFNTLINPSSDILKWRIANDNTSLGAISFNAMFDSIENIRNLLASTYIDIIKPSSFHKKVMINEVQNQISTYKFGQTEVGSYILNLVSPLGFYQYQLFDPNIEDLPINRKININMLKNINNIQQSIENRNSRLEDDVASGSISVNFLNHLSKLYEDNRDSDVSISAAWNIDIPTLDEDHVSQLTLNPNCIEKVVLIAEKYTPTQEQNILRTFYGKITNINGAPEIDSRKELIITVATIGDENQKVSVKVELDNAEFSHIVTEAFENGANVKVSGTITTTTKSIRLIDAQIERLD